jgi:hypothetical protein
MDTDMHPASSGAIGRYPVVLLISSNVGSLFEDPDRLLGPWVACIAGTIATRCADFVAIHLQEMGGKSYKEGMAHVDRLLDELLAAPALAAFHRVRYHCFREYTRAERFAALGSVYLASSSLSDDEVEQWSFVTHTFVPFVARVSASNSPERTLIRITDDSEFALEDKFDPKLIPNALSSRKGFLHTRWRIAGIPLHLTNLHLFHDDSNIIAMQSHPSEYAVRRRLAVDSIYERCGVSDVSPSFLFGDFNFRLNLPAVTASICGPGGDVINTLDKQGTVKRICLFRSAGAVDIAEDNVDSQAAPASPVSPTDDKLATIAKEASDATASGPAPHESSEQQRPNPAPTTVPPLQKQQQPQHAHLLLPTRNLVLRRKPPTGARMMIRSDSGDATSLGGFSDGTDDAGSIDWSAGAHDFSNSDTASLVDVASIPVFSSHSAPDGIVPATASDASSATWNQSNATLNGDGSAGVHAPVHVTAAAGQTEQPVVTVVVSDTSADAVPEAASGTGAHAPPVAVTVAAAGAGAAGDEERGSRKREGSPLSVGEMSLAVTIEKKLFQLDARDLQSPDAWRQFFRFDSEIEGLRPPLLEHEISFAPTYPYEEDPHAGALALLPTRCPAWCDRVLMTEAAWRVVCGSQGPVVYEPLGLDVCVGDHKPVALSFALQPLPCSSTFV